MPTFLLDSYQTTSAWLGLPATWIAVLVPALVTLAAFIRHPVTRAELLAVLVGILATCASAKVTEVHGVLALHSTPWYTFALLLCAGLQWYLPPIFKGFGAVWIVLVVSDFIRMTWALATFPVIQLPLGIGGAGWGDALFIDPVVTALTLWALAFCRQHHPGFDTRFSRFIHSL